MKHLELAKYIDHTLLNPSATPNDILTICEEAKRYKTASVCVNSCYVPLVHQAKSLRFNSFDFIFSSISRQNSSHYFCRSISKKDRLDAVFFDILLTSDVLSSI